LPEPHRIGCHELRRRFGYYLDQAAAGREVEVSRHGRPCVRLVPERPTLMVA
jgi:prevent-host-death family protein